MNRSQEIANRIREVFLDGRWIANTNYKDQLLKLDWKQSIATVENLNSIAALTYHINYYLDGLLKVFKGGNLEIKDKYSFDLPPVTYEKDWERLRESLLENAATFAEYVESMSDEKLHAVFVDEKYGSYLRNIEAIIEHSYYHLGQVSLIAKLLGKVDKSNDKR